MVFHYISPTIGNSPLIKGQKLNDKILLAIASHYNKTTAQILLRWGIQKNIIEIPKSSNYNRITENAYIYDFLIDKTDMAILDNLV